MPSRRRPRYIAKPEDFAHTCPDCYQLIYARDQLRLDSIQFRCPHCASAYELPEKPGWSQLVWPPPAKPE